jgi:asparagine synthase (glutamine-hydrolysing)
MCGINVLINGDDYIMDKMQFAIHHRGVRQQEHFIGANLIFGHTRLPILGLDLRFDQPFNREHLYVMGVGEFLNFRMMDVESENDFHTFLGAYLKYGDAAFPMFDGFWQVAVYNDHEDSLTMYADPLGKKPLYYRRGPDTMSGFSSEIYPLTHMGDITPDPFYLSTVAKWGYCPFNNTPFKEIRQVSPGTAVKISNVTGSPQMYSYPYIGDMLKPRPNTTPGYRYTLLEAVKNRLVSDLPIAVLCSGGLDSTIILRLIQKFTDKYDVYFIPNGDDEKYIKYLNVPDGQLHELKLDTVTMGDAMNVHQVPVDLGSVVPQVALARAVRNEGYNVCLTGDGADELFGGYGRAARYDSQYSDVFSELPYYHLPRLDRCMMSETIELRSPFLSWKSIRTALAVSYSQRTEKQFLKKMFQEEVPRPILERKKEPLKTDMIRHHEDSNRLMLIRKYIKNWFGGQYAGEQERQTLV